MKNGFGLYSATIGLAGLVLGCSTGKSTSTSNDSATSTSSEVSTVTDTAMAIEAANDSVIPTDSIAASDGDVATPTDLPATETSDAAPCAAPSTTSGAITISGQSNVVISGKKITSTTGDCVTITNSTNVTIENSEIGPCGGNAIKISGSTGVNITDSYIHPDDPITTCCDLADGIFITGASSTVLVQGNVITYGETNIEIGGSSDKITIIGNFFLNPLGPYPRGQQVQAWGASNIDVENNYGLSSTSGTYTWPENQEDAFNFGLVTGTNIAKNNYITGGHSPSGCGLIADDGANNCTFQGNTLLNTGGCGIGIASGTNNVVDSNRVLNDTPVSGAGNTAIYVWSQYETSACGPTQVTNNIASQEKFDSSTLSGYWDGGGCDPVTETGNTWNAAAVTDLTPTATQMPPPPIPPVPYACKVVSPY